MTTRHSRLAALILLPIASTALAAGFAVRSTVKIPGDGGWDYVTADAANRRLYVTHGGQVDVLDLDSLASAGTIKDAPGVHGVAIDAARRRGFITCGRANRVDFFDLTSLAKTGSVNVGQNPDSLAVDADTGRVFVFNGRDGTASVIDGQTVLKTFPVGGRPEFAVADGRGSVYVNLEDQSTLAEIDVAAMKVRGAWKLDGCEHPTGLAYDPATRRLFSGCGNRVLVESDPDQRKVVASVPIGGGVDMVVADPDRRMVFASNGDGTLTQILEEGPDRIAVVANVPTERGARTAAVDTKTRRVFLPTSEFGPAPDKASNPRARPPIVPGTFHVLVVGEN